MNMKFFLNRFHLKSSHETPKVEKLNWLGHVIGMDQTRVDKKFFESQRGRSKVARFSLKHLGDAENDL
jgi:hypothetical protein